MPNPNPKITPEFEAHIKPKYEGGTLAKKPICVCFLVEVDAFLRSLGRERSEFVRQAVQEKMERDASIG